VREAAAFRRFFVGSTLSSRLATSARRERKVGGIGKDNRFYSKTRRFDGFFDRR
jgi:hypothetical protein